MANDEIFSIIKSNLYLAFVGIVLLTVLAGAGYFLICKKLLKGKIKATAKQLIVIGLISGYLIMVFGVTFLNRGIGIYGGVNFKLFSSYREAWNNFDVRMWQYLIFNIIMFIPLGVLLPMVHKKFQKIIFTMLAGLALTMFIELLQFVTSLGIFELDDIFNNLLGTLMGYSIIMTFININSGQKHNYKKAIAYLLPFLIVIAAFTGMFIYYNAKEFGNLSINYIDKLNMKNTNITANINFNSEGTIVSIYKAPKLNKESSKEFAINFFENININTSGLEIIDYHDEAVYWVRGEKGNNSYNIWLNNYDGSFKFTDYSSFDDNVFPKDAQEEIIKEKLKYFDINIPEKTKFTSENAGDFKFTVERNEADDHLTYGELTCSYYSDDTIKNINNKIVVYEKINDAAVISEKEAYDKIKEGKFKYYKDADIINMIEINDIVLDYRLDSKGYLQPVYAVNSRINDMPFLIVIPALCKR